MKNQKEFMKWFRDFKYREFVRDRDKETIFYEVYKAIYEEAVIDTEERLHYDYELEREEADMAAYREGERHGRVEGWDEGYEAGYEDGFKEGLKEAEMNNNSEL